MILVVIMIYVSGKVPVCVISQQSDSHILHPQINSLSTSMGLLTLEIKVHANSQELWFYSTAATLTHVTTSRTDSSTSGIIN